MTARQTPDAVRKAAIELLAKSAERAGCVEVPKGLRGGDVALVSSEIAVSAILAALDSRAGDAGEGDDPDHQYAVTSSNYARPFLVGAYATLEAAILAQGGKPDKWHIYRRVPATPAPAVDAQEGFIVKLDNWMAVSVEDGGIILRNEAGDPIAFGKLGPDAKLPATGAPEPFGYWVEQKHADPVLLRKPAYIPEPSENCTVTPLYAAPAVDAVPAGEVERLARIRTSMALLQQNSEGCAQNHYGDDAALLGMPGWLIDTKADLDAFTDLLAKWEADRG